ncbi:hypothetical protein D3C78_841710 [compost metagenome]
MHESVILCMISYFCGVGMIFRADESAQRGFDKACRKLIPHDFSLRERASAQQKITDIIDECGPVVEGYPSWHPFLMETDPASFTPMTPDVCPSYRMLDHTVYLTNGIITCPYKHAVGELFSSIEAIRSKHELAYITIEEIKDVALYNHHATPILIKCRWKSELEDDGTIPLRTALGLMLEREIPGWRWAKYNQSWESMRGEILGYPHGARSSLFVNQQSGQQLKSVWNQLIKSGLWGEQYK